MQYASQTVERAERAVRCLPFRLTLFESMQRQGVPLKAIVGEQGLRSQYTQASLPELVVENHLIWLIRVGVLRREVDGQGITDSFRLTPLGHRLVEKWHRVGAFPSPSLGEQAANLVNRWLIWG